MNIIFKENLVKLDQKFIILDLDTFRFPDGSLHTACCIVENISIPELAEAEHQKEMHENLIKNYGLKNWNYCEQAIEQLMGKWEGEIDTFYQTIKSRIEKLKTQDLDDNWTPVIPKT